MKTKTPKKISFSKLDRTWPELATANIVVDGEVMGTLEIWYLDEVYDKRALEMSAEISFEDEVYDFHVTVRDWRSKSLKNSPAEAKHKIKSWAMEILTSQKAREDND